LLGGVDLETLGKEGFEFFHSVAHAVQSLWFCFTGQTVGSAGLSLPVQQRPARAPVIGTRQSLASGWARYRPFGARWQAPRP
ncbi:MAG: hypothetical protein KDJ96_12695, partial [Rhodobacteraceae bacterium]|nr:hypothetical protein [Paracoccaceae bacterium]